MLMFTCGLSLCIEQFPPTFPMHNTKLRCCGSISSKKANILLKSIRHYRLSDLKVNKNIHKRGRKVRISSIVIHEKGQDKSFNGKVEVRSCYLASLSVANFESCYKLACHELSIRLFFIRKASISNSI